MLKNFPLIFNFIVVLSVLWIIGSIYYVFSGLPFGGYVILSAVVPFIFLVMRLTETRNFIDNKISSTIGDLKHFNVYTKSLPGYRFVDIYNSVSSLCSQSPGWVQFESQHTEPLAFILTGQFYMEANRKIKMPERVARPIKERTEGFFSIDSFWMCKGDSGRRRSRLFSARDQCLYDRAR